MHTSSRPMQWPLLLLLENPQKRRFANPCFTQIHPTCIPRSGDYQSTNPMSESLRNDGCYLGTLRKWRML